MHKEKLPTAPRPAAEQAAQQLDLIEQRFPHIELTTEREAHCWQQVLQCRQVMRDFLSDPTLAHKYSSRRSWSVWMEVANNTLIPDCKLAAHINFTGQAMREIVETVVPNNARGPGYEGEVARDHARLEQKKAAAVNRIAIAGAAMLSDYPSETPRHLNMLQFMQDHADTSGKWVQRAIAQEKAALHGSQSKVKPAFKVHQQSLFDI